MPTDIAIARAARLRPIGEIAARAGIPADALHLHGRHVAKVDGAFLNDLSGRPPGDSPAGESPAGQGRAGQRRAGKLVLVTAISPTPAGEGKTTTTIGLGDALNRTGRRTMVCLREPSLGPCFGQKGGATGGGYAQVVPMEAINLHFTGDFHAITTAHNLLAALIDNHVHWGNALGIDPRRVSWRRVLDMNDRALREIVTGLGGVPNGAPREAGFDITVASEVMAVFCLSADLADLQVRLGRMIVAETRDRRPVTPDHLEATGAMSVLLRDALRPNLVQTIEGSPALVHGGPFANIAHGCNSVVATRAALALADYVVTEAGFGADLGAEKFLDIKCRQAGLAPDAAVVVATIRALKMHGGVPRDRLDRQDVGALERGFANLARHVANLRGFGLGVVVAVNHFATDTAAEHERLRGLCRDDLGVEAVTCRHWAEGGAGAEDLAHAVATLCDEPTRFAPLYPDEMSLADKIGTIASRIYGAGEVAIDTKARRRLAEFEAAGFGDLPVCMAKTQYSFSTDPTLMGAPTGHVVPVRDVRLAAGAGFVVAICGDVMTMPGLPRVPAAAGIGLDADGHIVGLS